MRTPRNPSPFGGERIITDTLNNNYKFTGQEFEPELNHYHFPFRQYLPSWGRFVQTDPVAGSIGDPQSLNLYAYVRNDPVNLTDPLGLFYPQMCLIDGQILLPCFSGGGFGGRRGGDYQQRLAYIRGFDSAGQEIPSEWRWLWVWIPNPDGGIFIGPGPDYDRFRQPTKEARKKVLQILGDINDCSRFFGRFDSSAQETFSQVDIRLDISSELRDSTAAHTQEGGSIIFLNDSGAFFNPNAPSPAGTAGTLVAQITILLHEFAHNIRAILPDKDDSIQSGLNTRLILKHCAKAISKAAGI